MAEAVPGGDLADEPYALEPVMTEPDHKLASPFRLVTLVLAVCAATISTGCEGMLRLGTGADGDGTFYPTGPGTEEAAGEPGDSTGSTDPTDPTGSATDCEPYEGSQQSIPLRRITKPEYVNVVDEVFGVSVDASALPADENLSGFYDNTKQAVLGTAASGYLAAAEDVLQRLQTSLRNAGQSTRHQVEDGRHDFGGARDDGFLNVHSTGSVYIAHRFDAPGTYSVEVTAYQQQAGEDPALLEVLADGTTIDTHAVTATPEDPERYVATHEVNRPGEVLFALRFANDFSDEEQDRNLFLDSLEIVPTTSSGPAWLACVPSDLDRECAEETLLASGLRLLRRPVTSEEREQLMGIVDIIAAEEGHSAGVVTALAALLNSAAFLYRVEQPSSDDGARLDGFAVAARLAGFLWRSTPDEELIAAAERGDLESKEGLELQARRMMDDPRARTVVYDFHRQWLGLDRGHFTKTGSYAELFTDDVRRAQERELELFLDFVYDDLNGSLDALLTAPVGFVDRHNDFIYDEDGTGGWEPGRIDVPQDRRAGLLTLPIFLTSHGGGATSSPLLRGHWMRTELLCEPIPAPPEGATSRLKPPPEAPETQRMISERTMASGNDCQSCHLMMDSLAFGLENFGAIGEWRDVDTIEYPPDSGEIHELPVDATGTIYVGADTIEYDGPRDLATKLAGTEQVRRCMTRQWFRYALGRFETAHDKCALETIYRNFEQDDWDLRELMIEIVLSDPFIQAPSE